MNWIFFCIAAGIGALIVGIVGFGSSLIILPVLLITYPTMFEPETAVRLAVGTTMATMTIGAISAGIAQHRAKMVDWSLLKFLLLPYFLGALSGPWISQMLPAELIVIVIAVLLLVISMRILFLGKRSPKFSGRNWRSSTFQISGVHLIIAFIILSLILWNYLKLKNIILPNDKINLLIPNFFLFLIFIQILLGAFVSGLDAGKIYNSWPLMNTSYFPLPIKCIIHFPNLIQINITFHRSKSLNLK